MTAPIILQQPSQLAGLSEGIGALVAGLQRKQELEMAKEEQKLRQQDLKLKQQEIALREQEAARKAQAELAGGEAMRAALQTLFPQQPAIPQPLPAGAPLGALGASMPIVPAPPPPTATQQLGAQLPQMPAQGLANLPPQALTAMMEARTQDMLAPFREMYAKAPSGPEGDAQRDIALAGYAAVDPVHFGSVLAAGRNRALMDPNQRYGLDRVMVSGESLGLDPGKVYWANRDRTTGQIAGVIGEAQNPGTLLSKNRGMASQRNAAQIGLVMARPWERIRQQALAPDGTPAKALYEVARKFALIEGLRQVDLKMTADQAVGFWAQIIGNQGISPPAQELLRDYWAFLSQVARQFGGAQQTPFEWFSSLRELLPLPGDSPETLRRSITLRMFDKIKTQRAAAGPEIFDSMFLDAFGYLPNFSQDAEEAQAQAPKPELPDESEILDVNTAVDRWLQMNKRRSP